MSYAIVIVFEGVTEENYWAVNASLGINRDGTGDWPEGIRSHAAGPTADGWVVIEKWESKEAQQAFMGGTLGAALAAAKIPAPTQIIETVTVNDKHID